MARTPAGLIPTKFQTFSQSNSTAVAVDSTVRGAASSALLVSIETQDARMRSDTTAPTINTGVLLTTANSPYWFELYDGSANMKFIRNSTGTTKISIMGFKRRGDAR